MTKIVAVSPTLKRAVWERRAAGERQAHIAQRARTSDGQPLDPVWVSKALCGLTTIRPGDPKVLALARAVGVPATEAFIVTRQGSES
ncbi:MAG: hypothetical protein IT180_04685 [Acidobacteria bacterium]|nr:hypothetical protein [Acidobacteriota bacterium]